MTEFKKIETSIDGLYFLKFDVFEDKRGLLAEAFNFDKLEALGVLPENFEIRQSNVVESNYGTTRGIHAGEGHKYVTPLSGRIFAAWLEMREGEDFGKVVYREMEKGDAAIVPQGVGNSFQVTSLDGSDYLYLISDTWRAEGAAQGKYRGVHLYDPDLGIPWPISLNGGAIVSEKDRNNQKLSEVKPYTLEDLNSIS